jgi:class 3 adenylate cyclase/pimeloyl-ACP methyl ester carboxylesterase
VNQPRIQYTKTKDGFNIAYYSLGEGLPLINVPPLPWSHLQMEWDDPDYRRWYQAYTQHLRMIRYDPRGCGLSDRELRSLDLDDFALDIDAVADRLGLQTFALSGTSIGGPLAMHYAASRPERVSHLSLWCAPLRTADFNAAQGAAYKAMREVDWTLFTETIAHAMVAGWGSGEEARRFSAIMRAAVDPDSLLVREGFDWQIDVSEELPAIQCPTLVMQRRDALLPTMEAARQIAALIPKAELVSFEGSSLLPWVGNMDDVILAMERFLGVEPHGHTPSELPATTTPRAPAGLVTILFTDIEGSTNLTQRIGDAAAQEIVRAHNDIVRESLRAHGGSETKHTGDGIMASFPLASSAIEAAIDIQRAVAANNRAHPGTAFRVRVGLNAGVPVIEAEDMFGTAVQLARRVCDAAQPGTILVTDVVRQLAAGKRFLFAETDETTLRGFEDPVRLYEVKWTEE